MFKGYIYRHWRVLEDGTEKSYIGQVYSLTGKANPQRRWGENGKGYAPSKEKEPTKFYNAIRKYGWDNFNHKVLFIIECETPEELVFWLDEWEKYYIWLYDSFYNGYNSTTGGNGGKIYDEEAKRKISKAHKGKHHSEEHKQKLSEAHKGKSKSEETKQKIREAHKGKPSPTKGKPLSEEHKQKLSEAHKGKLGKPLSEEHKRKISEVMSKKVICLENLQVFDNTVKAGEWCGVIGVTITNHLKGRKKSAGKHPETGERLHWMYLDEYEMLTKEKELKN